MLVVGCFRVLRYADRFVNHTSSLILFLCMCARMWSVCAGQDSVHKLKNATSAKALRSHAMALLRHGLAAREAVWTLASLPPDSRGEQCFAAGDAWRLLRSGEPSSTLQSSSLTCFVHFVQRASLLISSEEADSEVVGRHRQRIRCNPKQREDRNYQKLY